MGTISTGIGLVSGIDSGNIIEQLLNLERRPVVKLEERIRDTAEVQLVLTELNARLTKLRTSGTNLRRPSTFEQVNARSADETAVAASARPGTAEGSYDLRVARLVQAQQVVGRGFESASARVGAGTLTVELGDARLERESPIDTLNGGRGVGRGVVEVIDRYGRIELVDLRGTVTLKDVVSTFNTSGGAKVTAHLEAGRVVLRNHSTGGEPFAVRDVSGTGAVDLGLAGQFNSDEITGHALASLGPQTVLSDLNDGRGVATRPGDGLTVTLGDGTSFDITFNLDNRPTRLGDLAKLVDDATGGRVRLTPDADDPRRLTVVDTGGSGVTVADSGNGTTAADLGIDGTSAGDTLVGRHVLAGYGSVLVSNLNGGQGLDPGVVRLTNAAGASADVDLAGAVDVAEILGRLNAAGVGIRAELTGGGNAIALLDTSGGFGPTVVADQTGTFADQAGLAGSHAVAHTGGRVAGTDMNRAWLSPQTRLTDLNGGGGVGSGKVRVTDSQGRQHTFNVDPRTVTTVRDLVDLFNASSHGLGLQARVNDTGDGLLLRDTAGGGVVFKVEDLEGSAARDLRLAGESETGEVDGRFVVKIDVTATDTLDAVRDKINGTAAGVRASVVNTGGPEPFRLSVSGMTGGKAGTFVFDAGQTRLDARTVSQARDAAVFLGGAGAHAPVMVTSGSNVVADLVPGLTLSLNRVTDKPVAVSVERNVDGVVGEVESFVAAFNELREMIDVNSKFNQETGKRGVLLGEPSVRRIETNVYSLVSRVIDSGSARYRILSDIGVRVVSGAKLEFDPEKFKTAWADDAQAVQAFFTKMRDGVGEGLGHLVQETLSALTDPVDGTVTRANKALTSRTEEFQKQITRINQQIEVRRVRLTKEFADLEAALSGLQTQQQAVANMPVMDWSQYARRR